MIETVLLSNGERGYILTRVDLRKSAQDIPLEDVRAAHIDGFDFLRGSAFVVVQDDDVGLRPVGGIWMVVPCPRFLVIINKYGPSEIIIPGIFDPYTNLDLSFSSDTDLF